MSPLSTADSDAISNVTNIFSLYRRDSLPSQSEISNLLVENQNFQHRIDSLNDIMTKLSTEKATLESSNSQLRASMTQLGEEHEKVRSGSIVHKANFDQEKKHRQHSVIKLAEQIQRSKAKDAEVEQLEVRRERGSRSKATKRCEFHGDSLRSSLTPF